MTLVPALMVAGLAGCATADRVQQLEEKVAALEEKVEGISTAAPAGAAPKAASAEDEKAAKDLYDQIGELVSAGKMTDAKAKMGELNNKYASTTAAKQARKLGAELEVIGNPAPKELGIDTWFQGEGTVDITGDKPTLLVFWEVWCPHCKREVPKVQETYSTLGSEGLQVLAVTKITRSATPEKVQEFIAENKLTYPMAKEDGSLSKAFNVSGIPAAAVVKDGKIVWRGHPARLNDDILRSFM